MATVTRGSSFSEGPMISTWNVRKGGSTKRTFTGSQIQIVGKAVELQGQGYTTEIETGALWKLSATIEVDLATGNGDTQQVPETVWEIQGHSLTRNILECTDRPLIGALNTETKTLIENKIKNPATNLPIVAASQVSNAQAVRNAETVYGLMRIGVEGKQVFSQILSRTITVPRQYICDWSLVNVESVLSKPQLISIYGVPNYISALLRNSGYESYDNTDTNRKFFYGFLENHPTYQTVSNNRIQIRQEWVYDRWTPVLYNVID